MRRAPAGATATLARRGLNAWWVMLVTVMIMLATSIWRETRRAQSMSIIATRHS
jgi:hypothetical protein